MIRIYTCIIIYTHPACMVVIIIFGTIMIMNFKLIDRSVRIDEVDWSILMITFSLEEHIDDHLH